ncbi:MAG: aminopeptidase N [Bdellovibrionales bacterium]
MIHQIKHGFLIGMSTIALVSSLSGCKSLGLKSGTSTSENSSDLTRAEAEERKARIGGVHYDLHVNLNSEDTTFSGRNEIRFELREASKPLRLDHYEGRVTALIVNGTPLPLEAKKPYWIELPASALKEGPNTVVVEYIQPYSRQGEGLHRFVDPQTKDVFLHSQFETFDANRFMPAFDQPDLKATLSLQVEAPAKWEVISTTPGHAGGVQSGRRLWTFEKTPALATYLFSLHAGPYRVWKDQYKDIPLRLFARPSMARYVRVKEWFRITKQGLEYFNTYFDYPYPFKKYDQLFVPEFNAGAMENVGAVTFNENFLVRGEVTRDQRRHAADVILHEMAHMWFGDIVTMKWWNDLWLNESFATFMASKALAEATEFKESWQAFFSGTKNWAYWEDGLVTTHPIEAEVPSVKVAFANFDGITYGKGASVLKQLNAYVGATAFQKGIQVYFKRHAFENAELKDFIAAIQTATDRDLNVWADRWLKQSGTDKIAAKWTCDGGKLDKIELITTPSAGAQFRPQSVKLALFAANKGRLQNPDVIRVLLTKEQETVSGNWNCPQFVYPNYGDEGYVSVSLDPQSLLFARASLRQMQDPLLRSMVWDDLWEMVRSTELPLKDYVTVAEKHFPAETDVILLNQIVETISGRRNETGTVLHFWPETERSRSERAQFVANIEQQYLKRFKSARAGSDAQKFWFDTFVSVARTPEALNQIAAWSRSPRVAPGFQLDLDRQWKLAHRLARYEHKDAGRALAQVKLKDTTDRGQRYALAVEAVQPELEIKEKWINILKQPKPPLSFTEARSVLDSLFPLEQTHLAQHFEKEYYAYLRENGNSENATMVRSIASHLAPLNCAPKSSDHLKAFLKTHRDFSPSVLKTLKVNLEEDERCQRVRAMSAL